MNELQINIFGRLLRGKEWLGRGCTERSLDRQEHERQTRTLFSRSPFHYLSNVRSLTCWFYSGLAKLRLEEWLISTTTSSQEHRSASARAFVHSLNILIKYARMYGFDHKRTEAQFQITWNELQQGLPTAGDSGFLLGVSDNKQLHAASKHCRIGESAFFQRRNGRRLYPAGAGFHAGGIEGARLRQAN
jgi:hypothetical protein